MDNTNELVYSYGKVKWFGGHNKNKNKDNDFGFVFSEIIGDTFVHKNELKNSDSLNENDGILFIPVSGNKGYSATQVYKLHPNNCDPVCIDPLVNYLAQNNNLSFAASDLLLKEIILNLSKIEIYTTDLISKLIDLGASKEHLLPLFKQSVNYNKIFSLFFEESSFFETAVKYELFLLPSDYINDNLECLADYLNTLTDEGILLKLTSIRDIIKSENLIYLMLQGLAPDLNKLYRDITYSPSRSSHNKTLVDFSESYLLNTTENLQGILKAQFSELIINIESNEIFKPLIYPTLIKEKLFKKDMSFLKYVDDLPELKNDPEFWFLSTIIPLIYLNNNKNDIEAIVLHELWQSLLLKKFTVEHPSFLKLFPQCNTLRKNFKQIKLSCEAFHWTTPDGEFKFLCRSKVCISPQILPELNKSYTEFSAFDWLAHFGINYIEENRPSKKDFSIKLAAYINRIRELHSRLNCRSCNQLMIPNMRYSRVEVKKIDPNTGLTIVTPVQAAYRLTVFKCNAPNCSEFGVNHYINHCIHYKCYQIIDSRDLKNQCSEGRYICTCGNCCGNHSNTKSPSGVYPSASAKYKKMYQDSPYYIDN